MEEYATFSKLVGGNLTCQGRLFQAISETNHDPRAKFCERFLRDALFMYMTVKAGFTGPLMSRYGTEFTRT
jgi:hypothetical protein